MSIVNADSTNAVHTKRMLARLLAVMVVFIMVSTAFVAVMARAEGTPEIWTSRDEYSPGETVEIYGGGFVKWVPVTVTISHPDIAEKSFVVTPDLYGRFVCTDYVAEIVRDYSTAVIVTATQVLVDGNKVATTQFYDPAAYIEGWTLMPHERWTTGDVKGYNEDDSVPMIVVINKKQLHGSNVVTMSIGVDMYNKTPSMAYGIDYLTQYWLDPPAAPFNTYANSSSPFYVNPSDGALSGVHRDDNIYDEGRKLTEQVWTFTFTFASGATRATIHFGAHLAVTDLANGTRGASYWPGESLHVRIVAMNPDVNNGNRDVPISVKELTGKPEMELMKECDPEVVLEGDTITFTVHWMNTGQAPAYCVKLWDELPWSVDLVPDSFLYWDSSDMTPTPPIPGPAPTSTGWTWDIGVVPAGLEAWLSFEAVVVTSESGWYENWVYLSFTDSHNGHYPTLSAVCSFYIPEPPSIEVEKSGPYYAHVGDEITYTYNVSNNGPVDLVNVDVVDDIVGTIATGLSIDSGDWVILTGKYTVKATDPSCLINVVTAKGEDEHGREVMDDDCWEVKILRPHIDVEKTVSMNCAKAGEKLTYTISWINPAVWKTTLYNVTLEDSLFGEYSLGTLAPGEGDEMVFEYTVTNAWDPLVNTVDIWGEDLIHGEATDSDSVSVDVVHPAVELTKIADKKCGLPGESITYTITVTNPSTADVWLNGSYGDTDLNVEWSFYDLKPGVSDHHHVTTTIPYHVDPFINSAWVTAMDHQKHTVEATASWTVDVVHPAIEIVKSANKACGAEGEGVWWTITVTNPASADVWLNGTVTDPLFALDDAYGFGAGVFKDLKPGQSVHFHNATAYYLPAQTANVENTAAVTAKDHQEHMLEKTSNKVSIDIVHPAIKIVKSADKACGAEREGVWWMITVTNPASADVWLNGTVTDPLFALDDAYGFGAGVFEDLKPGQSVHFHNATAYYLPAQTANLENTAEVVAYDHQKHELDVYSNTVSIDIVHPAIEIVKSANKTCGAEREGVWWTITVTNPASADVWLNGTVTDPLFTLDKLDPSWNAGEFRDLEPGQSVKFHNASAYYLPAQSNSVENTASVDAFDHQYHELIKDSNTVSIDIVHPDVQIVKSANKACGAEREGVWWMITVTNPASADVWLNGTVTDPLFALDDAYGFGAGVFKDLKPGQSVHFHNATAYYLPAQIANLENTAEVVAYDHQKHELDVYSNTVSIDIVHPAVQLTKTADRYLAHVGDVIHYTVTVTNPITADVMLNGSVTDSMFGNLGSFSSLAPGTSTSWYPTHTVLVGDPDTITNTAKVTAKDHQEHLVTAEASWTVTVLRPDIHVTKESVSWANVGDVITYYVNVTNIGNCDLFNVSVMDTLKGELGPIAVLLKGETVHLTYQWTVPASPGTLDNTVVAKGEDRLHLFVDDEASWTVNKYVAIKGMKAADYNANGVWDDGEPGLMSWLITLEGVDVTGAVIHETDLTDSLGHYEFTGLKAGHYWVNETLVTGWHNFSLASYSLTLGSGALAIRDFLNMPFGSISGHKFQDDNMNGTWDKIEGELGISGWTIYLTGTTIGGLPVSKSTTTGAGGLYTFTDLMPGTYRVSEEMRMGWFGTTPSMLILDAGSLDTFEFTDQDFGNVKLGGITGWKWLDENMNGYEDGDEPFLAGWKIILDGTQANGTHVHKETYTGPSGCYAFLGLLPGVYTVTEVLQDGWANVTPLSREITIVPGSIVTCAKFGNVPLGCIEGWKFLDWDMDGMKDGNEPGISGWKITLTGWLANGTPSYDSDNATHITPVVVYTNDTGGWKFCGLKPGVYFVTEESKDNWYHTTPATLHFEIKPVWHFGLDDHHCIIWGATHVKDVKFGNVPYTCLWGYKWNDLNGDGKHQENEPGLAGWTIKVVGVRNDGVQVDMTLTTDANGKWETCFNILPGTYRVYEDLQGGWAPTSPVSGSYSVTIPMSIEPVKLQYDFMNFQNGRIKGYKYEDMNGDKLLDAGDAPIQNWIIKLENSTHVVIATTITAGDGSFEFAGLSFGTYYVVEQSLTGWVNMTPISVKVDVVSGTEVVLSPFLNVELSTVFGYKFNDLNGNGTWDLGEPGIPGWTIYMRWDKDPTTYSATTDASGYYEFTGLMPDGYYLLYEADNASWTHTNTTWEEFSLSSGTTHRVHDFMNFKDVEIKIFKFNDLDDDGEYEPLASEVGLSWTFQVTDPKGDVSLVTTDASGHASFIVTVAGQYIIEELPVEGWCPTTPTVQTVQVTSGSAIPGEVLFGNFKCVDITIFKYEDVNSNGVFDEGTDVPIEGWEFSVWNMTSGTRADLKTDVDGKIYLQYCTYENTVRISEMGREGWCEITPDPQSQYYYVYVYSGHALNTATGKEQHQYDFGNFKCAKISVFKYWDKCSSEAYDPGYDVPLEGWFINVLNATGVSVRHGYTDAHGYFNFTICKAGTYTVVEEDRTDWSHINPASGKIVIEVKSGDVKELQFGNYKNVKVCVFKYQDKNSDGMYNDGDTPISGWNFELVRTGDGYKYTAVTGPDGKACFEVNRSGIYRAVEEDREGWTHINPLTGFRLVDIVSGEEIPLLKFGNFHDVCIPVFKFADVDGDGCYDPPGEHPFAMDTPIQGWNFTLWVWMKVGLVWTWVKLDTKATNADGFLCFKVNRSGEYKITEEAREGWIWIVPRMGFYLVTVWSGREFCEPFMFGNFKFGKITGHKWNDLNGNGQWDLGEPGLPGWTIHFKVTWPFFLEGSAVTDKNGSYEFTGLPPGFYKVWEDEQPGWIPTNDTEVIVGVCGNSHVVVDFFNFEKGCIEGYKYEDVNGNGKYDPAVDEPIQGWNITLSITTGIIHTKDGDISAIAIVTWVLTDENGHYEFCGLGPGIYIVSEEIRSDWTAMNATSEEVTLTSGAHIRIHDFLNFHPGSICGSKFEDLNSNGVWDKGEPPIEGWKITMLQDALPPTEAKVAYTNATGGWCFDDLKADYYLIWEETRAHWTNTTQTWFEITISSGMDVDVPPFGNFHNVCIPIFKYNDVNGDGKYEEGTDEPIVGWEFTVEGPAFPLPLVVVTNETGEICVEVTKAGKYTVTEEKVPGWVNTTDGSLSVEVESGDTLATLMFGNYELGLIEGYKYYDWNANGLREIGEEGLQNWVIVLEGPGGPYTQLTDGLGHYEFTGLMAGDYTVSEDLLVAPPGWKATTLTSVPVSVSSGDIKTILFGNVVYGNITGCKFYDKNMNGVRDDDEPGLAGWTIKLDGVTDHGIEVHRHTTTNACGCYKFLDLQPGKYSITEVMPWFGEWVATTPLPQVRDSSGAMTNFTFVVDIGNVRYAKICGQKFLDTYSLNYPFWPNGIRDWWEFGLGNWKITLQGWTDTGVRVDEVRYTDNVHIFHIGDYCFDRVLPGRYWVNETLLFGYYATRPISNLVIVYPFPLGPVGITVNFGNLVPSKDPEVPFVLQKGWNLWSSPLTINGGLTAKGLLAAIGPSAKVVSRLDEVQGKYLSYVSGNPDELDFEIVVGDGYFVYVNEKTTFSLKGDLRSVSSVPVVKGWNLIGYDKLEGTEASKLITSGVGCNVKALSYLDAESGVYRSFVKGYPDAYDFEVTSGRAYFVYVDAAGNLSL